MDSKCNHDWVHIGDQQYTLRKARQIAQQYECRHCGAFSERIARFLDYAKPFRDAELAALRTEEQQTNPVTRRRRERAAGQVAIGEPSPILYTPPPPRDPALAALGERIRDARIAHDWTLAELATQAGYDRGQLARISQIQAGRVAPTGDELRRLTAALDLDLTPEQRALAV